MPSPPRQSNTELESHWRWHKQQQRGPRSGLFCPPRRGTDQTASASHVRSCPGVHESSTLLHTGTSDKHMALGSLAVGPPSKRTLSSSLHPALVSADDLHDCTGILPCQRNGHVAEDQGLPPTAAVPLPRPPNFRSCAARSIVGTATSRGVQVAEAIRTERALRQSLLSQQPWRRSLSSMDVSAEYPSRRRLFHSRLLESPGGTLGLSHPSNTMGPTSHGAREREDP